MRLVAIKNMTTSNCNHECLKLLLHLLVTTFREGQEDVNFESLMLKKKIFYTPWYFATTMSIDIQRKWGILRTWNVGNQKRTETNLKRISEKEVFQRKVESYIIFMISKNKFL